jgi:hypothetical protein
MASASSNIDITAPAPTANQSVPLPNDDPLHDIEDTRDLIARRNQALESLPLDEKCTTALDAELSKIGWPISLTKGGSRTKRPDNMPFDDRDIDALICIKRHINATPTQLRPFFENQDTKKLANKWRKLKVWAKGEWDQEDDEMLVDLYEVKGKTFTEIAEQKFEALGARELQINYVMAKERKDSVA